MMRVFGIVDDEMNLVSRIQVMIDQHQRPVSVRAMHGVGSDHRASGGVHKVGRGGKDLVRAPAVLEATRD